MATTPISSRDMATIAYLLRRRHHHQVLQRSEAERARLAPFAAWGFLPADGSLTFSSPLVPLGQLILLVFNWQPSADPAAHGRHVGFVRGYRAWHSRPFSTVMWDEQGAVLAADMAYPLRPDSWLGRPPGSGLATLRLSLDLDRVVARRAQIPFPVRGRVELPPAVSEFPIDTPLTAEATPLVLERAAQEGIPWPDAWQLLRAELAVPENLCPPGRMLIDTRLCTVGALRSHRPQPSAIYHDLRGLLHRPVYNPLRDGPLGVHGNDTLVAKAMRQRLAPDIAAACSDHDLLAAANSSQQPLVVRGLSHVGVWHLPDPSMGAAPFNVREFGHRADLWSLRPGWLERLGLIRPNPRHHAMPFRHRDHHNQLRRGGLCSSAA